jgi:tetratricopeptide (TPR) repeat protein
MKHICSIGLALIFFLSVQTAWGQTVVTDRINEPSDVERGPSLSKMEKKAAESYAQKNFYAAMKYYRIVLKTEPLNVNALKGYGESALEITALDSAEAAFQRLVDRGLSPSPDYFPKMRLAEVKVRKGDYDGAIVLYDDVISVPQTPAVTPEIIALAKSRKEFCEWALEGRDNPDILEETYTLLDTLNVNTREYSEYAAEPTEKGLYFSSYKFDFKKDKAKPKRNLIKLLQAEGAKEKMSASLWEFNDIQRQHTAHITFSESGEAVYYCAGDYVEKTAEIRFDIYRRKKQADGLWGMPEKLSVNAEGYTNTKPALGTLPGDKYETLFFVSDRPGGKGGRDIWYSRIIGDSLTTPLPLSAINTKGDDVTPYYHSPSNTLYYSTDGLRTIGGLDVYKSKAMPGGDWGEAKHMGTPINSPANDVYFSLGDDSRRGYMSNNTRGDLNNSEEGCCYDIYSIDFIRPKMKAIGLHADTKNPLPYTRVTLYEIDRNGQWIPIANPQPDSTSNYPFELIPGRKYVLVGEKDRFSPDTLAFSTPDEVWQGERVEKLYLKPKEINLIATVYDEDTKEPIYGATAKFYDLAQRLPNGNIVSGKGEAKTDLLPGSSNRQDYKIDFDHQYQVSMSKEGYTVGTSEIVSTLDRLDGGTIETKIYLKRGLSFKAYTINTVTKDTMRGVTYRLVELGQNGKTQTQNDPEKKDYQTSISYDKRYVIVAEKEGFLPDSLEFLTTDLEKIPFQTIVKELRMRPLDVTAFLPIPLYFDNDYPDPRTMKTTTDREYRATFVDYIRKKEEFKTEFTKGLTGADKQAGLDSLERFFEVEVRGGWNRLMEFSEALYIMLERGDSIQITLKGYASPRAGTQYNKNLTDRRVSSVHKHFDLFDGSIYKRFVDNGQLVILREANGESKAPKGISDNIADRRKSVYDVRASRERRLEIVGVKVNQDQKL